MSKKKLILKAPIIYTDNCILPHIYTNIQMEPHHIDILNTYENSPIILLYQNTNKGIIYLPSNNLNEQYVYSSQIVEIKNINKKNNIYIGQYKEINLPIDSYCYEYQSKLITILTEMYNNANHITNQLIKNIIQVNIIKNINNYNVDKLAFFLYNHLFEENYEKVFALQQPT